MRAVRFNSSACSWGHEQVAGLLQDVVVDALAERPVTDVGEQRNGHHAGEGAPGGAGGCAPGHAHVSTTPLSSRNSPPGTPGRCAGRGPHRTACTAR